jgi:hypothetical protein
MLRVFAGVAAFVIMFVVWFLLEFVRAKMTEGLPWSIQLPSMSLPIIIAGAVAGWRYRATVRRGRPVERRGFPVGPPSGEPVE